MTRICLVGCGNVGSRHLQAIIKIPQRLQIDIIEPSLQARKIAKSRVQEIDPDENKHEYSWHTDLKEVEGPSDVTIVATISVGRGIILQNLLEKGHQRFLIEKFVCQSEQDYKNIISKFEQKNAKGWVNTNPRCFDSYKKLKNYFDDSQVIHFSVTSSNISALATNSIHYLDLFSYFIDDYNIFLNGDFLIDKLFPNKRGEDLVEFAGTLLAKNKNGSTFSMTFLPAEKLPTIVNIVGIDKHVMIDETNEKVYDIVNPRNEKFDFKYEYASDITTKIILGILEKDTCNLTGLKESFLLHKEIFRVFNAHIKKISGNEVDLCPIT